MEELMMFHLAEEHRQYYNKDLMIFTRNAEHLLLQNGVVWENNLGLSKLIDLVHCCSVCQGMLQVIDSEPVINHICEKVVNDGFEFDSFKFNVHSPLSTNFRYSPSDETLPPDCGGAGENRERQRDGCCPENRVDCSSEGALR